MAMYQWWCKQGFKQLEYVTICLGNYRANRTGNITEHDTCSILKSTKIVCLSRGAMSVSGTPEGSPAVCRLLHWQRDQWVSQETSLANPWHTQPAERNTFLVTAALAMNTMTSPFSLFISSCTRFGLPWCARKDLLRHLRESENRVCLPQSACEI